MLLTFILFYYANLTAQSDIPMLKKALSLPKADSCHVLYELGKQYESVNIDSCFYFLKEALAIARHENNNQAIAQAMFRIGYTYTIFVRNDAQAIEWLNKAIEVAKKSNDNLNLARSYQHLGLIATYQQAQNAEALLTKALDYAKVSKDWQVLATTYDILNDFYSKKKRYKEAEIVIYNAFIISEQYSIDDWLSQGLEYMDILQAQNKQDSAYRFSQRFTNVTGKLKKSKGDFVYHIYVARLETWLKHYDKADTLFQQAIALEKAKVKPDSFRLSIIYRYALQLYIVAGNAYKAGNLVEELTDIRTAIKEKRLTQDSKFKVAEVKSAFELEQKESEIALLDEQKKQQHILFIGTVVIAVLLVAFMAILQRNKQRIERQKEELTALNGTKDRLFAILSHDLMSPIATLKNYMMLMDWGVMNQEQFAQSSERLKIKVNNVHNLLENVLHWSITQMQGIKPKVETVNIHEVINEQITLLASIAETKGIGLTQAIKSDAVIKMDKNHLALIIRNLLQNALKFTSKGGTIHFESQTIPPLGLLRGATEGGQKITIQDTGIGMPKETLDKLFKVEQNVHKEGTAQEGGTGLGLILTKELVELNGGKLEVESKVGKGTQFSLMF